MSANTVYANWWSRLFFAKSFEQQFFIPVPRSAIEYSLMRMIERWKFSESHRGLSIDRPVFIVGLPRSGTTLLYNLICAHERAAYVTNSMNSFTDAVCTIEWLRKKLNLNIRGERFLQDSIEADFGSPSEPIMFWGKWAGRNVDDLSWSELRARDLGPEKVAEIHEDVRRILYSFGGENRRFVCKYPIFQTELRLLQDLFPDAKFIHIVRDGRPTANSLAKLYHLSNAQIAKIKHPWVKHIVPYPRVPGLAKYVKEFGPDDLRTTAHVWKDAIGIVEKTRPDLRSFMEIRYEDLLTNPHRMMADIFDFCELDWPAASNAAFADQFAGIGVTRHKNAYRDYAVIEEIAGETLRKYNYLA